MDKSQLKRLATQAGARQVGYAMAGGPDFTSYEFTIEQLEQFAQAVLANAADRPTKEPS